jgi:hypothetical protein
VLFMDGVGGLLLFGLWVFCLIDVITTDESLCRNLQKTWWLLVVLLLLDVGAVIWLVAGRAWQSRPAGPGLPYRGNRGHAAETYPEYQRPGRFVATRPDDDEDFLRRCRERAEEQRRRHRERSAEDEG